MTLDVNTERGQRTLEEEAACARVFELATPGVRYIATPKDSACRVDAVLTTDTRMLAVVEQKSRFDVDVNEFRERYSNEWLLTWDKLTAARTYAKEYSVPLYGFLWIVRDRSLLVQRLTDRVGAWVCKFRVNRTRTQATVNGGTAVRENAFIDMAGCAVHREQAALPAPQLPPKQKPAAVTMSNQQWLDEYEAAGMTQWGAQWR